jgi:hypothetical protein
MARKLTPEEIQTLASRKNVKVIAVQNFLSSCPLENVGYMGADYIARKNCEQDARDYKWNAATVKAINDGLKLMFK